MKKVIKKKKVNASSDFGKFEAIIERLAIMTSNGFERLEHKVELEVKHLDGRIKKLEESVVGARKDILDLHDKFIHRREFDQLSLRVSKLEEKARR
jgi:hypothetical protein